MWDKHLSANIKALATSIPYWDNQCGEYFYEQDEFESTLIKVITNIELNQYSPRKYILENLSFEKQGKDFLNLFNDISNSSVQLKHNKTLLVMAISLYTDDTNKYVEKRDIRKKQYIDGFNHLFDNLSIKYLNQLDIIVIDNTFENSSCEFPDELIIKYSNTIQFIGHNGNQYGRINKGAGLIANWEFLFSKNDISKYEYIIHFEPRQQLISGIFFESFFQSPRTLFKKPTNDFYTGLFSMKIAELKSFVGITSQELLTKNKISIETHLYQYYKDKISYDTIEKIGLIRHDPFACISEYH
jgi:hypothetical protein